MLKGSFDVGFKVRLHFNDLGICMQMAGQGRGIDLPLMRKTMQEYEQLMEQGHGDEDISSLYRLKRNPERTV